VRDAARNESIATMNTRDKLIAAVTDYDRRMSARRGHNPFALSQYIERVNEVCRDIDNGRSVRDAILAGFNDRLCDACLRALGEPVAMKAEFYSGALVYQPMP